MVNPENDIDTGIKQLVSKQFASRKQPSGRNLLIEIYVSGGLVLLGLSLALAWTSSL
jgi:hypothetical protein